jgi:hypothetical protein
MKKNKILDKIKSGEVKMKPKWGFKIIKWAEVVVWLLSIGLVVLAWVSIGHFVQIYDPRELSEFGDLGWQIFYEDFPYIWGAVAVFCLILGSMVWINTGNNYKKSWQKNLITTLGVILAVAILALYLRP